MVNPHDAGPRDIRDGDLVTVCSRVGAIDIPAVLSEDIMPGVVSIPHGWGHDMEGVKLGVATEHAGVNTNILTDDYFFDGLSGNAALNGVPVTPDRADERG